MGGRHRKGTLLQSLGSTPSSIAGRPPYWPRCKLYWPPGQHGQLHRHLLQRQRRRHRMLPTPAATLGWEGREGEIKKVKHLETRPSRREQRRDGERGCLQVQPPASVGLALLQGSVREGEEKKWRLGREGTRGQEGRRARGGFAILKTPRRPATRPEKWLW